MSAWHSYIDALRSTEATLGAVQGLVSGTTEQADLAAEALDEAPELAAPLRDLVDRLGNLELHAAALRDLVELAAVGRPAGFTREAVANRYGERAVGDSLLAPGWDE